jgi:hypothetical protein
MRKILLLVPLLVALAAMCQTNPTNTAPAAAPAAGVLTVPVPITGPSNSDPLVTLMMQQPSIDTASPVLVSAEFDPPLLPLGERATYRLTVTAMSGAIQLPDPLPAPPGLELKPGGQGEAYTAQGTKLQPRTTFLFHARAATNGLYSMPEFNITAYGKPIAVPASQVSFLPLSSTSLPPVLRLTAHPPPEPVFVGQAVPLRLVLANLGQGDIQGLVSPQLLSEAFIADPSPNRYSREAFNRDGQPRLAFVCEMAVTPIREGRHTVLAQAQAIIYPPKPDLAGRINITHPLLDTDPFTIEVQSLPEPGQLPGFTGAIGEFQLDPPRLSTNVVRAGEPFTLTVTVRGEGNFMRFTAPRPPTVPGWQLFPPMLDPNPTYQGFLLANRSFTYTLIPLSDQSRGTPPLPFCYFDPKTKRYVDLTIPPVSLKVVAPPGFAAAETLPVAAPAARAKDEDSIDQEHEWNLTGLAEIPGSRYVSLQPAQQQPWFLWLQTVPASLLASFWAREHRRRYLADHPEVLRKRRARRGLHRQLRRLRRYHAAKEANGFALAGVDALREVCAPFTAAHPQAIACQDVLALLPPDPAAAQDRELVRTFFNAADAHRFNHQARCPADVLALRPDLENLVAHLKGRW